MSRVHKISPGDWIGALAHRYGLRHWSSIWQHAENDSLRALRDSPDMLVVGDELRIPEETEPQGVEVPSGHRVVFLAHDADVLKLSIRGIADFVEAFGPIEYRFSAGRHSVEGVLEKDGQTLTLPLDPAATQATLTLSQTDSYTFHVGGLGPVNSEHGARGRLLNLGFGRGLIRNDVVEAGSAEQVPDPLATAVYAFQTRHGLPTSGTLDPDTLTLLESEYGG